MESNGAISSVVHVGSDGTLLRDAIAACSAVRGPDAVVSVESVETVLAQFDSDDVDLLVYGASDDSTAAGGTIADLRESYPDTPCLCVVGTDATVDEAISAGATDVFVRRDGVDETAVLARRLCSVSAVERAGRGPVTSESTEALLDELDDMFYLLDSDGHLCRWNEQLQSVTGYSRAELAEMHALDFFEGEDEERIADTMADTIETGAATVEAEIISKDGTRTPIEYSGALVTDSEGETVGIVGIGRDLTDRKEREGRLLKLRQHVETLTDSAPVSLFDISAAGTVTSVRGETLPESLDESPPIHGRPVSELFAGHESLRDAVSRALDGEAYHGFVSPGETTLEMWLQPLLDETGSVDRVVGLVLDVTEREQQAQMLRQIREHVGEVIWITDPEKDSMEFISDSYADIWGRSPASLRENPTTFVDAIHPEDRERVEAALADQRENPDEYDETYRVVHPDGQVRWVHDRSSGIYEDGELERIVGIATDITRRKAREGELELKNRAIEEAPVGIAIHSTADTPSPIIHVNEQFETLTGYDEQELAGDVLSILAGPETDDERFDAITSAVDEQDAVSEVVLLHRADGTPFWGQVSVAPVRGGDGTTDHVVTFLQDVTESKEHEQEIERQLDEFGDVLAEQLGTPLRTAQRRLETAQESGDVAAIEAAERSLERAVSLVDDLTTVHSFSVKSRRVSETVRPATEDADSG